jgi:hypothetical protein
MKHPYKLILWVLWLGGWASTALAQEDSTVNHSGARSLPDSTRKHSYFELGVHYQSDNVFMGRKDSVPMPYTIPMVTYNHRSGLYFSLSAAWLKTTTENRIDVVTMEGGYAFKAGHYSGDFTASKYFYNSESVSITSGIQSSLSYQNSYNLGFIRPVLTGTLDFGENVDLEGSFGLEHKWKLLDDDLEITASFMANGSTLNFYDNYYKEKKFKKVNKKKTVTGTETITGTVINPSAFRILDYEFSAPISYALGDFTFSFTPSYAMPVNPSKTQVVTVLSTGGSTTKMQVEKLSNTFFFTAGVSFEF